MLFLSLSCESEHESEISYEQWESATYSHLRLECGLDISGLVDPTTPKLEGESQDGIMYTSIQGFLEDKVKARSSFIGEILAMTTNLKFPVQVREYYRHGSATMILEDKSGAQYRGELEDRWNIKKLEGADRDSRLFASRSVHEMKCFSDFFLIPSRVVIQSKLSVRLDSPSVEIIYTSLSD